MALLIVFSRMAFYVLFGWKNDEDQSKMRIAFTKTTTTTSTTNLNEWLRDGSKTILRYFSSPPLEHWRVSLLWWGAQTKSHHLHTFVRHFFFLFLILFGEFLTLSLCKYTVLVRASERMNERINEWIKKQASKQSNDYILMQFNVECWM